VHKESLLVLSLLNMCPWHGSSFPYLVHHPLLPLSFTRPFNYHVMNDVYKDLSNVKNMFDLFEGNLLDLASCRYL